MNEQRLKCAQLPCDTLDDGTSTSTCSHKCDILLNNFKIKEKSHRVLLNCRHLVWERCNIPEQNSLPTKDCHDETFIKCHLATDPKTYYGPNSRILFLTDIIRISRGVTKSNSLKNAYILPHLLNENNEPPSSCQYLTVHYAKRIINSPDDCNRYQVHHLTLHKPDEHTIIKWQQQLEKLILMYTNRIKLKRLLVFINPYGGRKKALKIYKHICKPIVQLAGIDDCCIITQRPNQIYDILMSHDLSSYDAVCCVGGDGTAAEMVNGLIRRTMYDLNLDMKDPEYIPKPLLPVAIIPAGSTDTITFSLHGTSDVQTATIHLVLGQHKNLDVCSIHNDDNSIKRFCVSLMSYGYLGDIAANSEKYRWMGPIRYEYTGIKTFLCNRSYQAEIRVLIDEVETAQSKSSNKHNEDEDTICYANCKRCNRSSLLLEQSNNSRGAEKLECNSAESTDFLKEPPDNNITMSPLFSSRWHTIHGKFFMIIGANITCACIRSPRGINRYGHLGDGYLELILVRKSHLLNNIIFLINSLSRNGNIRNLQFVEIYRTRQFHFKSTTKNSSDAEYNENNVVESTQHITSLNSITNHSQWNCDGEILNDYQLKMKSHRQIVIVLMRGPQPFIIPENGCKCNLFCCCKF